VKLLRAVLAAALCLVAGTAAADPVAWPSTSTPVTITTHAVFQVTSAVTDGATGVLVTQ
jgi:hypothetical protein